MIHLHLGKNKTKKTCLINIENVECINYLCVTLLVAVMHKQQLRVSQKSLLVKYFLYEGPLVVLWKPEVRGGLHVCTLIRTV